MKKILFLFLSILVPFFGFSSVIAFHGSYGSDMQERILTLTNDGGYIVGGNTDGSAGDAFVQKVNSIGQVEWIKIYAGADFDMVRFIETYDNNFILLANTSSFGAGIVDICLMKIDNQGDILFQKTIGTDQDDFGIYIIQTNDQGFIVLARTGFFSNIWLLKLDSNLNIQWQKAYGESDREILPRSIIETPDGYLIAAYYDDYSPNPISGFLIKLDKNGNILWQKKYSYGNYDIEAHDVTMLSNYYSLLVRNSGFIGILKVDSSGNTVAQKYYSGYFPFAYYNMLQQSDGSYLISGIYDQNKFITKFSSNLNILWSKKFTDIPSDVYNAIYKTSDGGYVALANANAPYSFSILKLDGNGEVGGNCASYIPISLSPFNIQITSQNSNLSGITISPIEQSPNFLQYDISLPYEICYGPLEATISANPESGDAPLTVQFNSYVNKGVPPYHYDWDFGDGTPHSNLENPTHIYSSTGLYYAYLKVTDSNNPPSEVITESIPIRVFGLGIDIVYAPKAGTTAGGTMMEFYGKTNVFQQFAKVYFNLSNVCFLSSASLKAEEVIYIDQKHLKVKTPRSIESITAIFIDNPTIEDKCIKNAYTFKTLGYTLNQVTQDVSVIDTVENKLFEPKNSFPLSSSVVPMNMSYGSKPKPGRIGYLINYSTGNLEYYDLSNFVKLGDVILQDGSLQEGYPGAFDIALSSDGSYGFISHITSGKGNDCSNGDEPCPGEISVIEIQNDGTATLIDVDNDPTTRSPGAPEGITRIEMPVYEEHIGEPKIRYFYALSARTVNITNDRTTYNYRDKEPYPGEYIFLSGVGILRWKKGHCLPGERCIPEIIPIPRQTMIGFIDNNPILYCDPANYPPGYCDNPAIYQQGGSHYNLAYWKNYKSGFVLAGTGEDGIDLGAVANPLDFTISAGPDGLPTVYALNETQNKMFMAKYNKDGDYIYSSPWHILVEGTEPVSIPTGNNPTDVKVQKVPNIQTPDPSDYITYAYITNAVDDSVSVIDTATNTELPYPQSPIYEDMCYAADNYPTSFDTRSTGNFGYSSNFNSDTVSVFDLPNNQCYSPQQTDGAIHVGSAPIRIVVQPVPSGEELFKNVRDELAFANPIDFTTPSKQSILINDWERVEELRQTEANPQAVLSNIDNFQNNLNKWVVNDQLKNEVNENVDLYRVAYSVGNQ